MLNLNSLNTIGNIFYSLCSIGSLFGNEKHFIEAFSGSTWTVAFKKFPHLLHSYNSNCTVCDVFSRVQRTHKLLFWWPIFTLLIYAESSGDLCLLCRYAELALPTQERFDDDILVTMWNHQWEVSYIPLAYWEIKLWKYIHIIITTSDLVLNWTNIFVQISSFFGDDIRV